MGGTCIGEQKSIQQKVVFNSRTNTSDQRGAYQHVRPAWCHHRCQRTKDRLAFLKQLSVDDARTWSVHAATQVVRDKTTTNKQKSKKQK